MNNIKHVKSMPATSGLLSAQILVFLSLGQVYGWAAVMSGKYAGVQKFIHSNVPNVVTYVVV